MDTTVFERVCSDVATGVRALRASPGVTITVVLSLAGIAIGLVIALWLGRLVTPLTTIRNL